MEVKPPASRAESAEAYIVCRGFTGLPGDLSADARLLMEGHGLGHMLPPVNGQPMHVEV